VLPATASFFNSFNCRAVNANLICFTGSAYAMLGRIGPYLGLYWPFSWKAVVVHVNGAQMERRNYCSLAWVFSAFNADRRDEPNTLGQLPDRPFPTRMVAM
jgi:hypothetical protein